ncbi:chb [Bugula neritina]|uniref:beta-N-acetylhexosaminidase n=1 Tax=Bugula neritina TaxID=10212 RepID=A0A7J7JBP0_BUGNE|nr:chb [Bugula neritina]
MAFFKTITITMTFKQLNIILIVILVTLIGDGLSSFDSTNIVYQYEYEHVDLFCKFLMPLMLTRTMIVLLSRVKTQLMRTFTVKTMKLKQKILLILLILLAYLSFELSRYTIDDLKNIHIHFATTAGRHKIFISNLTLLNNGWFPIDCGPHSVTVYACFLSRVIDSENTEGKNVYGFPINAKVHHLDGCAHKVVFAPPFRLAVGENITVSLPFRNKFISYTDYMPNLYIQLGDGPRWLVSNTDQDPTHFVLPFDAKNKLQRASDDLILPLSLSERYLYQTKLNQFSELEVLNTHHNTEICSTLFHLPVNKDGRVEAGVESQSQHTALLVTNTITHLLHRFDYKLPVGTSYPDLLVLPCCGSLFDYRGFMLDVARHFFDKEVIKRQIELLSYYNLNRLHLHLTDDESWSLEIDGIPELTEIGSRQCFDLSQCGTYPQLGKKLDMGKQFLTKSEYIEIVRFAESKGVMVIPEIDLPGHSTAALNAMKMRYVHSYSH